MWWSIPDVVAVRAVKALREAGCPLQTLRRAQEVIRSWSDEDAGGAILHWDGRDLLRIGAMGDVVSLVQHPGQAVLHVVAIPVGEWHKQLAAIAKPVDVGRLRRLEQARVERARIDVAGGGP